MRGLQFELVALAAGAVCVFGCGGDGSAGQADAQVQPDSAGGLDAGADGVDAGPGRGADAGPADAGMDAGPADAGMDAAPADAGMDAGPGDDDVAPAVPGKVCLGHGWCWQHPLPQGFNLYDVWVEPGGDVWAVGAQGTALRRADGQWTQVPSSFDGDWQAVWAMSGEAWAGTAYMGLFRYDGTSWVSAGPAGAGIRDIGGTAPDDVWAVGAGVWHYDGTSWTEIDAGGTYYWSVSVAASGDVWLGGINGSIHHYDGGGWTSLGVGSTSRISGIADTGTDVWALDERGSLYHLEGGGFVKTVDREFGFMPRLWALLDQLWVTDANTVWHRAGDAVSVSEVAGASFQAIGGSSAQDVWAVGRYGVVSHYDGTSWNASLTGPVQPLRAVWGTSATDVWAGGDGGLYHFDGEGWTRVSDEPALAFWGTAPDDIWAVGDSSSIKHYDGSGWAEVGAAPYLTLEAIWGSAADDIWAAGQDNNDFMHYDGSTWAEVDVPEVNTTTKDIWGTGPDDVWAVGEGLSYNNTGGQVLHYAGAGWEVVDLGFFVGPLNAIWGTSASNVFAVGRGAVLHFDGTSWTEVVVEAEPQEWLDVFGTSESDVWIVSKNGEALHFDGTSWTVVELTADRSLHAVWGPEPGKMWIVGDHFTILHREAP